MTRLQPEERVGALAVETSALLFMYHIAVTVARLKQHVVRLSIRIEIGRSGQDVAACDSRPGRSIEQGRPRQIPHRTLSVARIKEEIVRIRIAIEVDCPDELPARRQGRAKSAGDKSIVV